MKAKATDKNRKEKKAYLSLETARALEEACIAETAVVVAAPMKVMSIMNHVSTKQIVNVQSKKYLK